MEKGFFVVIKSTYEIKKIIDIEIICNEKIYYMEDQTSYHESQISTSTIEIKKGLYNKLYNNQEKIDEIYKNTVKDAAKKFLNFIKNN